MRRANHVPVLLMGLLVGFAASGPAVRDAWGETKAEAIERRKKAKEAAQLAEAERKAAEARKRLEEQRERARLARAKAENAAALKQLQQKAKPKAPAGSLEKQAEGQKRKFDGSNRTGELTYEKNKPDTLGGKKAGIRVDQGTNDVRGGGADGTNGLAKAPGEVLSPEEQEETQRKAEEQAKAEAEKEDCLKKGAPPGRLRANHRCGVILDESRAHLAAQNIEGLEALLGGCDKATAATAGGCAGKYNPIARKRCQEYQQFAGARCGSEKERGYQYDLECWRYQKKALDHKHCQRVLNDD